MKVFFTIPYPPSQNHYIRRGRGGVYQHPAAVAYKNAVGLLLRAQKVSKVPKPQTVSVTLRFYRPRASGDLDNSFKLPFDACNGLVWDDDSQVKAIHAYQADDKKNPRVEVVVESC